MDQSQALYAPDTTTHLIKLFQATFDDYFKTYWEAWPSNIPPTADFPLVIIQKQAGKAVIGPTSTDEITETFIVTIMLNKADDAGSSNVRTTTMRKLQNLIEGQDPTSLQYKPDTFLYVLRSYLTQQTWLLDSDVSIKYNQVPLQDLPTMAVADISVTTQRRVIVPSRGIPGRN